MSSFLNIALTEFDKLCNTTVIFTQLIIISATVRRGLYRTKICRAVFKNIEETINIFIVISFSNCAVRFFKKILCLGCRVFAKLCFIS